MEIKIKTKMEAAWVQVDVSALPSSSHLLIGSLSNDDGNAKENVTFKYFKLLRESFNSFNLCDVAEQSGGWLCKDGVTVQVEKFTVTWLMCSRST